MPHEWKRVILENDSLVFGQKKGVSRELSSIKKNY
jgi:hypothetical protein